MRRPFVRCHYRQRHTDELLRPPLLTEPPRLPIGLPRLSGRLPTEPLRPFGVSSTSPCREIERTARLVYVYHCVFSEKFEV